MITYGNFVGVSPKYSTDFGLQKVFGKKLKFAHNSCNLFGFGGSLAWLHNALPKTFDKALQGTEIYRPSAVYHHCLFKFRH
jgi:hypothetical protein